MYRRGLTRRYEAQLGSGRGCPPNPPHQRLILEASQPPKSDPFWGRISPVFSPLWCKVVGGWGGSAHYPDPTAQSARAPPREPSTPGRHLRTPPDSQNLQIQRKNSFFFSVVVESCCCARRVRRSASIASRCVPCPAGAPLRLVMPNG